MWSFGLCASPWVFTKLLKVAVTFLCRSGIRLVIYLDDLLIVGTTTEECPIQWRSSRTAEVIRVLESLGFLINFNKSETVPTQCIEYIGLSLIWSPCHSASPIKRFATFAGYASKCWRRGNDLISSSWPNNDNLDAAISLNEDILADLKCWTTCTDFNFGKPMLLSRPDMHLSSDACVSGWWGFAATMRWVGLSPDTMLVTILTT
jgi:hypothetical protein